MSKTLVIEKGSTIKVTANYNKRTFTIRKKGSKYRTHVFTSEEFYDLNDNTSKDWDYFLKNEDYYYLVK